MPAFIQAQHQLSPNTGPVSSVGVAYSLDTPAHCIGLAWVWNSIGGGLTSITDLSGNGWCNYTGKATNANGFGNLYVCQDMAAAPAMSNFVQANGVFNVDGAGGPIIQIAQFSAKPGSLILAAQPNQGNLFSPVSNTGYAARLRRAGGGMSAMMVAAFYDQETMAHGWGQAAGTQVSLDTIFVESNGMSGCMAYGPATDGQNGLSVFSNTGGTTLNMFYILGCIIVEP